MRILFATSNGTGLGHLSRALAIARRLPDADEAIVLTLSTAAPVVDRAGFRVEYVPAYRTPGAGSDWQWNLRLRRRLEALLAELRPDVVAFDGVHPYRALTHVLTGRGERPAAVWCRRPMWRQDANAASLRRAGAFDLVLEPGELAADADRGPTVRRRREAVRVAPIVYLDREQLLPRDDAERELGLDPGRPHALVALGQGAEVGDAVARVLALLGRRPELQVAALESSLAAGIDVPSDVVHLQATFPISRYYAAFDLAIAAAGYNAFHELLAFGVPTLFVPASRQTDDQAARARWAAEAGVALACRGPSDPELEGELEELLDPDRRERVRARAAALPAPTGAAESAAVIGELAAGRRPGPAVRREGALRRYLLHSAYPVGPSLPLAAALTARQLARRPQLRGPRAAILALGVPAGELREHLGSALGELGTDPGRVLVITDTLELDLLRTAGIGFERVPAASELNPEPSREEYARLLERRVAEILRGRRPRRALAIGRPEPALMAIIRGRR